MSRDQRLSAESRACLAWFSRLPFFERRGQEITLENLSDGYRLWEALQELNPSYFTGNLPAQVQSAARWANNLQNIKHVYKSLKQYILEVNKSRLPHGSRMIDIKAIAEGIDDEETAKLLKWTLVAASNSVENQEFMAAVMDMSEDHQKSLMAIILESSPEPQMVSAEFDNSSQSPQSPSDVPVDTELYNEEMYGKVASENSRLEREKKELQRDLRDLNNRINRLQENNNELVEELRVIQDQAKKSSADSNDSFRVRDLEKRVLDQDDHIAVQEGQIAEHDGQRGALQTEINKLRKANEKLEPLQDTVDELRHERESLVKKNNALERYRAKVQSVQEVENENKDLRRELEELRDMSKDGDDIKQRNISLQREVSELTSLMANTEIQLVEAQTRRKQIEYENAQLREHIDASKTEREQDRAVIADLEQQLEASVPGVGGLDIELKKSENEDVTRDEDLVAKNIRLVKASTDSAARCRALQKLLDEERAKNVDLEKRYFDAYAKNLTFEEVVRESGASEGARLYQETKRDLAAVETQAAEFAKDREALQQKLKDAQKILSLVDKTELEGLEHLRELNSEEIRENRAYVMTLENKNEDLKTHLDEHRKMLSEVLMKQHQGRVPTVTDDISEQRDEKQRKGVTEDAPTAVEEAIGKTQENQGQAREIETLKSQLRQATDKAAPELLKASAQFLMQQEMENIKRENRLMSTAYFDLSSRLQMNNVSLQRRSDAPRSFLNKQRALVNQATAIRSR